MQSKINNNIAIYIFFNIFLINFLVLSIKI